MAVLTVLIALLGTGAYAVWHVATTRLETELTRWARTRTAEGWRIAFAPPVRTGFPLSAGLRLEQLRIEAPTGLGWQADRLTLALVPQDIHRLHVGFGGTQALRHLHGATPVEYRTLGMRVRLDGRGGTLEGEQLRIGTLTDIGQVTAEFFGTALNLQAERFVTQGLPGFDTVRLTGRLTRPPEATVAAWRNAGGAVSLERGEFRTGEVVANMNATLTLDAELQPEGRGTLQLTGGAQAVALLAQAGLIAPGQVPVLRTVIGLAGRVPAEGGPPRVDAPLELRHRRLSVARLPIMMLPEIDWR